MKKSILSCSLVAFLLAGLSFSQPVQGESTLKTAKEAWDSLLSPYNKKRTAFAYVENNPKLPNVLIYGDSISIAYTKHVRKKLEGKANLYRLNHNGGDSTSFIGRMTKMHKVMRDEKLEGHWDFEWDLIHFNVGLHDLKFAKGKKETDRKNGKRKTSIAEYQKNLRDIIAYLKKLAPKAKLIFATTTPVPEGEPQRYAGDAVKYNQAAMEVLKEHPEIIVNDLYTFTKPNLAQWTIKPSDVHYKSEARIAQGAQVSKVIIDALQLKNDNSKN